MNTPTPETDAFENERHTMNAYRKVLDFARKLERERNEVRASYLGLQQEHIKVVAERDQLRKVCDELAGQLKSFYPDNSIRLNIALRDYSQLPHVKAKGNKV